MESTSHLQRTRLARIVGNGHSGGLLLGAVAMALMSLVLSFSGRPVSVLTFLAVAMIAGANLWSGRVGRKALALLDEASVSPEQAQALFEELRAKKRSDRSLESLRDLLASTPEDTSTCFERGSHTASCPHRQAPA